MTLAPGTRVGGYEVLGLLGQGGMGEVYRTRDLTLGRDVAIKVLAANLAADAQRVARFTREARVLAALNHPHIGTIYGVEPGNSATPPALVLELVEGETLEQRLAREPLTLPAVLDIARQIADAMDFAHERGVIHRDLKPANIKITPEGRVKVLDFGIAKALGDDGQDAVHDATRTGMTQDGIVIGTPAYMSPEQARGQMVDRRTDVWAFGCVLYEMLTGVRAFQGSTGSDVMVAVLRAEPEWTALPPETPLAIRRLVRRCLEKDTRKRLRDVGDALADLIDSGTSDGAAPARTARSSGRFTWIAGFTALAAAGGWAVGHWAAGASETVRVPVPTRIVRLTNGPAREFAPAISPDRKWVAYIATDTSGRTDVWVRFIGGGDAINLTSHADLDITTNTGIAGLAIAPDGNRIAVMAKPRNSPTSFATWEIPAPLPGGPRKLLDDSLLGVRWSPDGRRIAFIRAGSSAGDALWVADADGTNRREIIPADAGIHIHWPAWSADGYIYFNRTRSTIANLDQSDVYRIRADGGTPEAIVTPPRRAMFPMVAPGLEGLFYASDSDSVDLALYWRPLAGGSPVPVTRGIGDYSAASLSLDGRAIVATYSELRQSLLRLTPNGTKVDEQPITDGFSGDLDPTVAASGKRLVFSSARGGSRWLWTSALDGSRPRALTSGDVLDQWPSISPDGSTVAFVSDRGGRRGIWLISSDGGSPRSLVHAESIGGLSWTRDGTAVVYAADYERWPGLFRVAVADGQVQRLPTAGVATDPACSPTDDVVAYMSPRTSGASYTEVRFVDLRGNARFENLPPAPQLSSGFANGVMAWSPDGMQLAIVSQNANAPASIWVIQPAAAAPQYRKLIELPPGPRIRGVAWTPDGRSLVVGKHDAMSAIVLIELQ